MQHPIDELLFGEDDIARAIILAINDMSRDQTYGDLTIAQICERANVSRTTFYRHFDSKLAAVKWAMRRVSAIGIGEIGRTTTWRDGFLRTLAATRRLGDFFIAGGEWADANYIELADDFVSYHTDVFETTLTRYRRVRLDEGFELVLRFWVYSLNAALSYWRIEGFRIPNEEMADLLERAVPSEVHRLMDITSDVAE